MERKHKILLMDIDVEALLRALFPKKTEAGKKARRILRNTRKKTNSRKWTKEQHEKFASTMEKKWGQKRK